MKNRTFGLILGSFLVLSPATQALCMSRLGALGALAAATVATQCKKAETFCGWNKNSSNNTNCFNNNSGRFNGDSDDNPDSFSNNTNCFNNNSGGVHQHTWNMNSGDNNNVSQRGFINIDNGSITIFGFTIAHGNSHNHVVGSGKRTTKTTPITGSPSNLEVSSYGSVTIKQGNEQSLVVNADDNIHQHLKQVVSAESIQLGLKENSYISINKPIEYTLTLRDMPNDLRASGSSSITTQAIKTEQMRLILSGKSKIYIPTLQTKKVTVDVNGRSNVYIPTLQTKALAVDASGASNVTLDSGSTDNQNLNISGASSYNGKHLKSLSAKVDLSGASTGSINAQRVSGDLSGASTLAIHGKPNNINVSTSGMSRWHVIN